MKSLFSLIFSLVVCSAIGQITEVPPAVSLESYDKEENTFTNTSSDESVTILSKSGESLLWMDEVANKANTLKVSAIKEDKDCVFLETYEDVESVEIYKGGILQYAIPTGGAKINLGNSFFEFGNYDIQLHFRDATITTLKYYKR